MGFIFDGKTEEKTSNGITLYNTFKYKEKKRGKKLKTAFNQPNARISVVKGKEKTKKVLTNGEKGCIVISRTPQVRDASRT